MRLQYLAKLTPADGLALMARALEALRVDYDLNIKAGTFEAWPGRVLTFEEFCVMMILEKDTALQHMMLSPRISRG